MMAYWAAAALLVVLPAVGLARASTFRVRARFVASAAAASAAAAATTPARTRTNGRWAESLRIASRAPHFLDVDEAFLRVNEQAWERRDPASARMLSLADYLSSLEWDASDGVVTVRHVIVTWCFAKLSKRWPIAIVLGLLPKKFPGLSTVLFSNQGTDALRRVDAFLGANSVGASVTLADVYHYLRSKLPTPLRAHIPTSTDTQSSDAVDDLFRPLSKHATPLPNPCTPADIRLRAIDLAMHERKHPTTPQDLDVAEFERPAPLLPDLFPGLCVGAGGLTPRQTPLGAARNEIVCDLLNRLSANALVWGDLAPPNRLKEGTFVFRCNDHDIASVDDFCRFVPGLKVRFSRHSSGFGVLLCLQEPTRTNAANTTPSLDPATRDDYAQIPLAWPARVGVRDPVTGRQEALLSHHSAVVIESEDDAPCPLGKFRVQFFLGPDGVTSWKPGNEFLRPWAPLLHDDVSNEADALRVVGATTAVALAVNWAASRIHGFDKGGYVLHGTCGDTTALVQVAARRPLDVFPLVSSGDAKAALVYACRSVLIPALTASCVHTRERLAVIDALERVASAALSLPNDLDIAPHDVSSAVARMLPSCVGMLRGSVDARPRLVKLAEDWRVVLSGVSSAS